MCRRRRMQSIRHWKLDRELATPHRNHLGPMEAILQPVCAFQSCQQGGDAHVADTRHAGIRGLLHDGCRRWAILDGARLADLFVGWRGGVLSVWLGSFHDDGASAV